MTHDWLMESDWKKFRKMVPAIRERYLEKFIAELTTELRDESQTSTERFWSVHEQMKEIAMTLRTCLDGHSRSRMMSHLLLMVRHQMLTKDELMEFSKELREQIERNSEL